jgi:hypothetical protein
METDSTHWEKGRIRYLHAVCLESSMRNTIPILFFLALTALTEQALAQARAESPIAQKAEHPLPPSSTKNPSKEKPSWPIFDPQAMPNSMGLWLDGEVLFWQSSVGSLDYGVESNSTTLIRHGHVKHPHFDWDWGFRLGAGYKVPYDRWDLFASYTFMRSHAHGHTEGSHIVFPSWASGANFSGTGTFYASKAKAHWHLTLNMIDLELGRNCFAGQWLTIRPFMGVRGLFIDQDYNVEYQGGTVAPNDEDHIHLDTDFWGVGIRMGFNSLWGLGKGFGLYGNGSASLLSGHFDVEEKEKLEYADRELLNTERDVDNVIVTADLALGLQWDYLFSKDRYHFGVKFGWELNLFFDQNQLFNFLSSNNPGAISFRDDDLSFQGLTLGLRFDF